ncbi:MAG TPA: hypothetical protein VJ739_19980, partial [Gemmataceae bacterium]|nr:hypothetical protein [Gemmataceae bacterium]
MFRARWAALALGAGITLTSGCSLLHRPCTEGCCTGMCVPEGEGYEEGAPVTEGPLLEGYPGAAVAPGAEVPALPPSTP